MAEEKKYKVIALSVGGANNFVYKSGDIVKESNFPVGNADKLAKSGFLLEIIDTPEVVEITAKELKEILTAKGIEYPKNASKAELLALNS
jgi:hypothetical protein